MSVLSCEKCLLSKRVSAPQKSRRPRTQTVLGLDSEWSFEVVCVSQVFEKRGSTPSK